jgi:zinc protease
MLSNGARVVYKRNPSQPDDILLNAYSRGGHSMLPDSLFASPARLVGMLMTASGGVGATNHDALVQQARTTGLKEFHVGLNTFDEQIVIGGSPREVEYLFQRLYLQFTAPTVDTLALADWRRNGFGTLSMSTNDQQASSASGHRRLGPPSPMQVPFIDLAQAKRVYTDRFGDASDFTFYLAGPSKASDLLPLVTRYIASLPSTHRTVREVPRDFNIPLPQKKVIQGAVNFFMPPEKAGMSLSFRGAMPKDSLQFLEGMEDLSTASWILGRRLLNLLREKMGVTYSVGAPFVQYWTPDPRYAVSIQVTTDPHMLDTTIKAVMNTVKEFRTQGPTDAELAMANEIHLRQLETARQQNQWWMKRLQELDRIGVPYDYLEHAQRSVPLTNERIRAAAEKYFPEKVYTLQAAKPPAKKTKEEKKEPEKLPE